MNGYSAANRAVEYSLLAAAGYACAFGTLAPLAAPQVMAANVVPMLACGAAVLFLPCFFKKAARIAGTAAAAAAMAFVLFRILTGDGAEMLEAVAGAPEMFFFGGNLTELLCAISVTMSLIVFFCGKSRLALSVFWAATTGLPVFLSLEGFKADVPALLVSTGCCALLFVRCGAQPALLENPEGHRLSLRMTAFASGILAVVLVITQLGFTALNAVFGSAPRINISNVAVNVRDTLFPTTGFKDYNPNELLGQPLMQDNTLVLEVQADGPFYLRGRVYDTYNGRSWQAATPTDSHDAYNQSMSLRPPGYLSGRGYGTGYFGFGYYSWPTFYNLSRLLQAHRISVTTKTGGQKYLFLPGTAVGSEADTLQGGGELQHTYPDMETEEPLPSGTQYSLTYWQPNLQSRNFQSAINSENERLGAGLDARDEETESQMQSIYGSTKGLTARTVKLAQSITAGCDNEFQKASAIEQWLKTHCAYTLNPPQPRGGQDFVDYFLFDSKKGYCEHFATAMTMLLRASGVPARYVEGYASPAVSASGLYEVTNAQSHAWVEYYSPLYGFITADPTPASDLPATLARAQKQDSSSSSSAPSSSSALSPSSSAAPSQSASSAAPAPKNTAAPGASYYWAAAVAVVILLLAVYGGKAAYRALWFAVVRRRDDRRLTLLLYGYFASVLMKLGFGLAPSGTPQELADKVRDVRLGDVSFDRVTELYVWVRFGEHSLTGGEREELFAFYRGLPAACIRRLGRLRYFAMYPLLH